MLDTILTFTGFFMAKYANGNLQLIKRENRPSHSRNTLEKEKGKEKYYEGI
nr:hypothetical protein [Niallia taxi]